MVKGSSSHGGSNNPHGSSSRPFLVFGEVAEGTEAGTVHVAAKSLIAAVNSKLTRASSDWKATGCESWVDFYLHSSQSSMINLSLLMYKLSHLI